MTFSPLRISIVSRYKHDKVTASMNAAIFRFFFYFSA
ncbi:pheST operon leader peptide PheM [Pantoea deleyi]|uniref:pheST attenuator peptide n=1 Tax=Pantoea deleyi TaxID=470932 RepID=A0A506Q7D4_9GAMM|nr:pheST operon leader peptide PheM [Pantoea deleyi]